MMENAYRALEQEGFTQQERKELFALLGEMAKSGYTQQDFVEFLEELRKENEVAYDIGLLICFLQAMERITIKYPAPTNFLIWMKRIRGSSPRMASLASEVILSQARMQKPISGAFSH